MREQREEKNDMTKKEKADKTAVSLNLISPLDEFSFQSVLSLSRGRKLVFA